MKRILCLLCLGFLLTGCATQQIEDRVLVISMGIDESEDGDVLLSVQIPTTAKPGGGHESEKEDPNDQGDYQIVTVTGIDWFDAFTLLNAAVPQQLHFGQVRQILIAEKLARSEKIMILFQAMATDHQIRPSAQLVVIRGEVLAFMQEQKPDIGQRLSKYIDTTLKTLIDKGFIPNATLGETVRDMGMAGWDPVMTLASLHQSDVITSEANPANILAGETPTEGISVLELMGGAVTDGTMVVGLLTGYEVQLLGLLRGHISHLYIKIDDHYADIYVNKPTKLQVISGVPDTLAVSIYVDSYTQPSQDNQTDKTRNLLQQDLQALLLRLQQMGADPIGFGAKAKIGFATQAQWDAYQWKDRYRNATIQVNVELRPMDVAS